MNIRAVARALTIIVVLGLGGIAVANGLQEPGSVKVAGNLQARGFAANQGSGAGQGPGAGKGAGQGFGAGQGNGQGRLSGSGTYGGNATPDQAFRSTEFAALAAMPAGTLQAAELASLLYLWEEEKLARDVYLKLGSVHSLPVFSNIARSEQTHMDQ